MKVTTDIDIDFFNREDILKHIKHIPASMVKKDQLVKHNSGVYLHKIPVEPLSGLASIEYKEAEERGYFKIDFLNNGVYQGVRDEEHLEQLMNAEPLWELLCEKDITDMLAHLNGHHRVTQVMKPTSVVQLAAVLAMIRPAKKHLIGQPWDVVMAEVFVPPEDGSYYFKKAHALAYAVSIIVQLNLICEQVGLNGA